MESRAQNTKNGHQCQSDDFELSNIALPNLLGRGTDKEEIHSNFNDLPGISIGQIIPFADIFNVRLHVVSYSRLGLFSSTFFLFGEIYLSLNGTLKGLIKEMFDFCENVDLYDI